MQYKKLCFERKFCHESQVPKSSVSETVQSVLAKCRLRMNSTEKILARESGIGHAYIHGTVFFRKWQSQCYKKWTWRSVWVKKYLCDWTVMEILEEVSMSAVSENSGRVSALWQMFLKECLCQNIPASVSWVRIYLRVSAVSEYTCEFQLCQNIRASVSCVRIYLRVSTVSEYTCECRLNRKVLMPCLRMHVLFIYKLGILYWC